MVQDLAVDIYMQCTDFRAYALKDQIRKTMVSISINIAKVCDHMMDQDIIKFFLIARAYPSELNTILYLIAKWDDLTTAESQQLKHKSDVILKLIRGVTTIDDSITLLTTINSLTRHYNHVRTLRNHIKA